MGPYSEAVAGAAGGGGGDLEAPKEDHTPHGVEIEHSVSKSKKLKLIPLIFLIYFEVSGGPFGEEPAVQAAGPLLALLGFIIFPFIWSIPEALVTAELATAYPGNGGYVVWAWAAFGPFWGFLMGWCKWISGVINNAAYPVLCLDYLKIIFSAFSHGTVRIVGILVYTIVLSFLNFTGLSIVGWTAVTIGAVSLMPFLLMFFFSIPKLKPSRWVARPQGHMDWSLYFNTLFWNLNFWDNASTLAGEVDNPQQTFPRALFCAGLLACVGYIVPLLAGTGALELNQGLWTDGYLADAAGHIAGAWLKYWIEVGAVLSTVGLFEAQLSSASFQLLGMAEIGLLPSVMAKRSRFNTPFVGILVSAGGTLLLSYLSFTTIISAANFLYSCGMLLEFASFLWLRRKFPALNRPYKVPVGIPGLLFMCAVPVAFLIFVMTLANLAVYMLSLSVIVAGVLGYFLMNACKKRNLMKFDVRVKNDKTKENDEDNDRDEDKTEKYKKDKEKKNDMNEEKDENKEKKKDKDEEKDESKEKKKDEKNEAQEKTKDKDKSKEKKDEGNKDNEKKKDKEKSKEKKDEKNKDDEKKKDKDKGKDEDQGNKNIKETSKKKGIDKEKIDTDKDQGIEEIKEKKKEKDKDKEKKNKKEKEKGKEKDKQKDKDDESGEINDVGKLKAQLVKLEAKLTKILEKKELILERLKEAEDKPTEENSTHVLHSVEHVTETFKEVAIEDKATATKRQHIGR